MTNKAVSAVAAAVALAVVPRIAAADPVPRPDPPFQKGLACFDQGDYPCAIAQWEPLLNVVDGPPALRLLYNLALAYIATGDYTRAIERYETFLLKLAELPGKLPSELEAKRVEVAERVRVLKAQREALRILPHPSRDVLVKVDSDATRPTGFIVWLLPGEHVVEIRPGTPQARRVTIHATAGASAELDPADPPAPPPPTTPPAPPVVAVVPKRPARPAEARSFPTGWLIGGIVVTAASTALPIGLTLAAKSKRDDAIALGAGSTRYAAAVDQFHSERTTAEIMWVVPAILAAATAVVVLLEMPSEARF